jgi:hypothetical protein
LNLREYVVEISVSRVINTQGVGKERNQLVRGIVIAIRELMKQGNIDSNTKDLAAFIAIALRAVSETIERTVVPWEKRNYWIKADKFRQEWAWANRLGDELASALVVEDWQAVAATAVEIGKKLNYVEVSDHHRMGTPWIGAWARFKSGLGGKDKDI